MLPGILGSVLQCDGHDVWAPTGGAVWRALTSLGHSITDLRIDRDDPDVDDLGDGVVATRLVPDVHLLPGLWGIDGYRVIKETVAAHLDVVDGSNWIDFPYDWRRDNRVAARRLAEHAPRWLATWRERSGNVDARLVLIAHSMGGLVARHYLELLGGWRDTRCLITFGTPYRGSPNAIDSLVHGVRKGIGPLGVDLTTLVRSMTSVHQLLPRYPCVDTGSGAMQRVADIDGLPGIDRRRAVDALQFHLDIDAAIAREGRVGGPIHPVVGILQPTSHSARFVDGRVTMLRTYDGADPGGDGTVPRPSATPVELSDQGIEVYVGDRHGSIQSRESALTHVVGILSDQPTARFREVVRGWSLDIEDLFLADEPVTFTATTDEPPTTLRATVETAGTGAEVVALEIERDGDGAFRAEVAPLPGGTYRVRVEATGAADDRPAVSDVFIVAGG